MHHQVDAETQFENRKSDLPGQLYQKLYGRQWELVAEEVHEVGYKGFVRVEQELVEEVVVE